MSGGELERIDEAAAAVRARCGEVPEVAIVLGSGLGAFGDSLDDPVVVPYDALPHWPQSRVAGHAGRLVVGYSAGKRVAALSGRVHVYEGHPMATVVFAARVMARLGVPWHHAPTVGNLLGTRMVLNEFVAYAQLGPLKDTLDPRSFTIATFALCGFANFASIGMQVGGIGALAPSRRSDLARLGFRAMMAGTLANFVTATIAGFLL